MHPLKRVAAVVAVLIAANTGVAQAQVKPAERAEVVDAITRQLEARYVFPDVAAAMSAHIRERLQQGAYDTLADRAALARVLTTDLRSISRDRHLGVQVRGQRSDTPTPSRPGGPVVSVRMLDGNVAHMAISLITAPERLGPELKRAFEQVKGADALILDLRDNLGGSPDGVSLLAGYLIPERTLLARIYSRPDHDTTAMWTTAVDGPHFARDVFILTNRVTFSAAEAVAYHLKHLGRAKVVGEASGGGAHRISGLDLPAGLSIVVPYTRPINVVTGSDWEGDGVQPDIPAAAADALRAAHLAALRALPSSETRAALIRRLENPGG
ncbi:MAG TPA: S41 family peptidase [Longimicrobiales bacterium]|nr:S41 family peptidase [Longimicrobiales bacterium]